MLPRNGSISSLDGNVPHRTQKRKRIDNLQTWTFLPNAARICVGGRRHVEQVGVPTDEVSRLRRSREIDVWLVFRISGERKFPRNIGKERREASDRLQKLRNELIGQRRKSYPKLRPVQYVSNLIENRHTQTEFNEASFGKRETQPGWTAAASGTLEEYHAVVDNTNAVARETHAGSNVSCARFVACGSEQLIQVLIGNIARSYLLSEGGQKFAKRLRGV